jgi:hypothetical protein
VAGITPVIMTTARWLAFRVSMKTSFKPLAATPSIDEE